MLVCTRVEDGGGWKRGEVSSAAALGTSERGYVLGCVAHEPEASPGSHSFGQAVLGQVRLEQQAAL